MKFWSICNARNDEGADTSSDEGARAPSDAGGSSFIGQVLGDRFVVERKLGQGTVGTVYRAEDRRDRRPVAVKILNPGHQPGSPGVTRLLDDAQRATRLLHPNVVPLIDHGVHAERFVYLVEPLLEGQELAQKLGEDRTLTPEAAMQLGVSMLHALEALHRQELLHLNLKPNNIFLMRDPFGMERAAVSSVGTRHLLGFEGIAKPTAATCLARPEYLCPEIVGGKPADARSDIYGVGVVLYEALAGRPPFAGGQLAVAAKRHVYEKPLGFKLARPAAKVPDALEALVLRCLNKSPGARYASANELTRALEKLLGGVVSADPAPAPASAAEAKPAVNQTLLMASGLLFKKPEPAASAPEPAASAPEPAASAPEPEPKPAESAPEPAAAPVIVSAAEAVASLAPQKTEPQGSLEPETKPFTPVAPVTADAETKPFVAASPERVDAPVVESAAEPPPAADEPPPAAEPPLDAEPTSAGDNDEEALSAESTLGASNGADRKGGKKGKKNKKGKRDTGAPANIASVAAPEALRSEPRKPEAEPAAGKATQAPATPKAEEPDWFELGETSVAALDEYHQAAEKEERSKFPLIVGGVLLVLGLGTAVIATRSPADETSSGKNPPSIGELAAAQVEAAPKSAAPTATATQAPTATATQAPTVAATQAPTVAATQAPTAPPTLSALEEKRLAAQQAAEQARAAAEAKRLAAEQAAEQARAAAEAKRLAAQQAAEQARAAAEAKRLAAQQAAQQAAQAAAAKRAATPAPASAAKPAAPAGPGADVLVAEGRKSLKEGRYAEARKSFEAALRADPRSAAAYAGLGDTAFQEQKFMDAVRSHTNAVRYAPRNVDYLLALGMACFKAEQLQDARKHWEKALSLQPGNEKATKYLKLVEKRLGQ